MIDWLIPKPLIAALRAEFPEETARCVEIEIREFGEASFDLHAMGEQYEGSRSDDYLRRCTILEVLSICRYTAEHLHRERVKDAPMVRLGQAVIEAMRAGRIKT